MYFIFYIISFKKMNVCRRLASFPIRRTWIAEFVMRICDHFALSRVLSGKPSQLLDWESGVVANVTVEPFC